MQTSLFSETKSKCSPAGHPASPSASQETSLAKTTTASSGIKLLGPYEKYSPLGQSLKTRLAFLLCSEEWYSNGYALQWKTKVTKSKRLIFQLRPKALTTDGTDFGLLPTPAANDGHNSTLPPSQKDKRKGMFGTIPSALLNMGMPAGTPLSVECYGQLMGYPKGWLLGIGTQPSKQPATPSSHKSPTPSTKPSKPPK